MPSRWPSILLVGLLGVSLQPVWARPAHRRALADYLGARLETKLNDCRTCHLPAEPGSDPAVDDRPHNPFGKRLAAVRGELRASGKKSGLIDRIEAVADEDSDGDGFSNLLELVSGRHPGDPADRPDPMRRQQDLARLEAFRAGRVPSDWSPFEPVERPIPPAVRDSAWIRNPIDRFIAADRETKGISPRPEADRATLLRRVSLDLTGLPPTPRQLHDFLEDRSPDAYERVVERLLASPQYGERWGRHWMDVWRYSDWAGWGMQVRDSQPHIWHWRDWIVESLNEDKGYDRMIVEMLAGDEVDPGNPKTLRATGYLARNYKLLSREKWMQDTVDHTAMAFLGITVGCAKCHDHMYDPISQVDYYRLRAVFTPHQVRIDRTPGEVDTSKDGIPVAYDADLNAPTYLFLRGDDRNPAKEALAPGVPEFLGGTFRVEPVGLPLEASAPQTRAYVANDDVDASRRSVQVAREKMIRADASLALSLPTPLGPIAHATAPSMERHLTEVDAHRAARAEVAVAESKLDSLVSVLVVERLINEGRRESLEADDAARRTVAAQRRLAVAEAAKRSLDAELARRRPTPGGRAASDLAHAKAERERIDAERRLAEPADTKFTPRPFPSYPPTSTGRRLALARWVVERRNPLTARVAVNHIWMRHFGQALVPSVFDFGRNGRRPTHPALLDWLADEFAGRGWSMKALHRLIVTSATYRQSSTPESRALAVDPENTSYWRFAPRRLEAEAVRDGLLFIGGALDAAMGGPEVDHSLGERVPRRSLYFRHAAEKQMTFLTLFDAASVTECYERRPSVLPQQALALANSDLSLRMAESVVRDATAPGRSDPSAFVIEAFERVLGRSPTEDERRACVEYLERRRVQSSPEDRSFESLVHVLFNHHEFVTIR
ncbi:MAG: DUF1549 and DUF1553 domain-containing protein [Isosphaeraceae bacterium]|nr:DUF1549 and DUF1553 domain-containing protein [Isosphaeraceae bacterium]